LRIIEEVIFWIDGFSVEEESPELPYGVSLNSSIRSFDDNIRENRIIGGGTAASGSRPYQIALLRSGSFTCGGSIINNRNVLTAAHCVSGVAASALTVRYNSLTYNSGGVVVGVSAVRVHPQWNPSTINNDVAVLVLSSTLTLGQTNAQASNLAGAGADPAAGSAATVSGWGRTSAGGALSTQLKALNVNIIARGSTNWGSMVTTGMIPAGTSSGTENSCNGDSGGPLTVGGVQHGVVSWGHTNCAQPGYPGVYARVGQYRTWIDQNLG